MAGFFKKSMLVGDAPVAGSLPKCGACGLYKSCRSPKMPVSGEGRRGILIVGEFPSAVEDETGSQFAGKSGEYLKKALQAVDINLRRDCWSTNALICKPHDNKAPDPRAVDYCRPNLLNTIKELNPVVVILLGGYAVRSLIGDVWKEHVGELAKWVGWNIPSQKINAWICPTYHPNYLLRQHDSILDMYFIQHLHSAVSHTRRPWKVVPEWEKQVQTELDTHKAAKIIRRLTHQGGQIAFDYENTALKPEYAGAEIVCASLCWEGKITIAYPWHGEAIAATREMLHSKRCGFIASNLKHENRWTLHEFGRPVRNWIWDTMLAAHTLDNREGVTGLKFQAFVHLGMPSYNDHIEQFLKSKKGKKTNQVLEEIDLGQLLHYCAMDSLLEFKLAQRQFKLFARRKEES